ncbi:hypothetical protein EVAR_58553_1 [Eumeta japonica]|uniref:Uncharacterized protein n=1 Tax=Eumeta variegata TaxID=151549 RepID=A0A4C1YIW0_EUMVA|nr:hypothetical protein EVAR_58553_1 [Eumeta japonica]
MSDIWMRRRRLGSAHRSIPEAVLARNAKTHLPALPTSRFFPRPPCEGDTRNPLHHSRANKGPVRTAEHGSLMELSEECFHQTLAIVSSSNSLDVQGLGD